MDFLQSRANDAVDAILGATSEKFWRLPRLATI